jgi:Uma2 family endonuclease
MTLAEFLEWEEGQPLRYEFDGVGPVAMVGGSVRHAQIQRNLAFALTARLRGKPCQFLGSDLKIQTEEDHARYPDGIVICSPLTGSETIVDAPVVIFEVLSPSTTHADRFVKAREYQGMPSVQRYVMLEQDSINAVVYGRAGDACTHEILVADSILALPEIEVELPLAELYEGIVFEAQDQSDQPPESEPA